MDLKITEEQTMLREMVRSLMKKEYPEEQVQRLCFAKEYPVELDHKLGELGVLGICYPEQYGGMELGFIEVALVVEELSRFTMDIGMSYGLNLLGGLLILTMGTEDQKNEYLPKMIQGEVSFSLGYSEPYLFNDPSKIQGRIPAGETTLGPDDLFVYTERRGAEKNIILVPLVKDDRLVIGIVPQAKLGTGEVQDTMGRDLLGLTKISVGGVVLEKSQILGEQQDAMLFTSNWMKFINTVAAAGNMRTAIGQTVEYSKDRKQFGRPIGTFQALAHLMVDTSVRVEASELYGYWLAWLLDKEREEGTLIGITKEINMANAYATSTFVDTVNTGIQVMGGYGYMEEVSMERYARDARMTTYFMDNLFLQKLTVAENLGINFK